LRRPFENEAGFFKHACGCWIVRKDLRSDSAERKIFETEISDHAHRFSHDATSPKLLAQPVTHCRCKPMHVLAWVNTNPADGCALNLYAKFHFRLLAYGSLQEFVRVLNRVRMREEIADAGRDRVPPARSCDCSRALPAIQHRPVATGEWCIARARAASISRY